jgi:hypothetical protein
MYKVSDQKKIKWSARVYQRMHNARVDVFLTLGQYTVTVWMVVAACLTDAVHEFVFGHPSDWNVDTKYGTE